jgi:hypothetical protein
MGIAMAALPQPMRPSLRYRPQGHGSPGPQSAVYRTGLPSKERAQPIRWSYAAGPEDQTLRIIERAIDLGDEGRYLVAVAGDAAEIAEETRSFSRVVMIGQAILAVLAILMAFVLGRFYASDNRKPNIIGRLVSLLRNSVFGPRA